MEARNRRCGPRNKPGAPARTVGRWSEGWGLQRPERELLTAHRGLGHQAALLHHEDRDAVAVVGGRRGAGLDGDGRGMAEKANSPALNLSRAERSLKMINSL